MLLRHANDLFPADHRVSQLRFACAVLEAGYRVMFATLPVAAETDDCVVCTISSCCAARRCLDATAPVQHSSLLGL